ncbi:Nucleotidylyl transferase [Lentinula edodes]|nr:Nucleotidylyl transferase [Lentinula edodes]
MALNSSSLQHLRPGSIHPTFEIIWGSHPLWPTPLLNDALPSAPDRIRILVLDSSFNPPTLAHLALANSNRPEGDYDAKLLLLSVRNADKELKPGDATHVQRLEMMMELAEDLRDANDHESNNNVAVAIIDEPTFVGKSKLLRTLLKEKLRAMSLMPEVELTFILGFDTLERLFDTKYYESSEEKMFKALQGFFAPPPNPGSSTTNDESGDGSSIVCARRSPSSYPHPSHPAPNSNSSPPSSAEVPVNSHHQTISTFLTSAALPSSCVSMIDIGKDVWSISSSEVRKGVKMESDPGTKSMEEEEGIQGSEVNKRSRQWSEMVTGRVRRYIIDNRLYK